MMEVTEDVVIQIAIIKFTHTEEETIMYPLYTQNVLHYRYFLL